VKAYDATSDLVFVTFDRNVDEGNARVTAFAHVESSAAATACTGTGLEELSSQSGKFSAEVSMAHRTSQQLARLHQV